MKYGGSALQLAKKAADAHSAASIAHSTAAYDKSLPDDERAKHQELAQHHSQQRHQYLAVVNRNKRDNKALRRLGR